MGNMWWLGFGLLCGAAAVAMFIVGGSSSHLSELRDWFWLPLPLGGLSFGLWGWSVGRQASREAKEERQRRDDPDDDQGPRSPFA